MMSDPVWQLPYQRSHEVAGLAGGLVFVGGAGDFDGVGALRHPGNLEAQLGGALDNVEAALGIEGCGLGDAVRIKLFYAPDSGMNEWEILAAIHDRVGCQPAPAITANPVPMQPFAGQLVQIQAIAQKGWRENADVRVVSEPVPQAHAGLFGVPVLTRGLRAGEFFSVPGRTAAGDDDTVPTDNGTEQTHIVMQRLQDTLTGLGATFQDAIKKEGYYFGTDMETWAGMAATRASYFREPAAPATVVPCQRLYPDGAQTKVEVLGYREEWNGFDKYIPRDDSWPKRVWDWPIPVPYRQGSRLRGSIWTGGQVPFEPGFNGGAAVYPGDLLRQTRYTMSYVDEILRGFGAVSSDLRLLVCYFTSDGSQGATEKFLDAVADSVAGPLPPITCVPQPLMHNDEMTVEIWGVAKA
ncbi:MAG: RidA family protein [Rhodospirillaceae bacterium]|jgi:enamine deaminase RidA (YjgF/YER057c/UK114 family)|nr:RidA family protein [Rhodospirillaceae bacterium]MBT6509531.1 RidA family protein [Rhodospirillaceae bacterium]MBT7612667.1 RidA family protein [Rhodospirillaceae bacterium]MBT7645784.1 RidA family protein [Rhodospirillaceae bacterium]